jgi:glutamate/aspartate transport system substrate-binding protein
MQLEDQTKGGTNMRLTVLGLVGAALAFASVQTADADELYGTLKKIKDSGTITIGRSEDSVPFSYTGPDGKPQGYSIDLCLRIVEGVKQELQVDKLEVRFVTIIGTTLIPLLVNGTVDMVCSTTTVNLRRQRQVDFLYTTFITGNRLLVKKESKIKEVEDLKGKPVSVNQGTQNEKIIKAIDEEEKLGIRFIDTKDQPQGWLSLETDRSVAHVTDEVVEWGLISKARNPEQYEVVGRMLSYDPYSIVVRRDDSAFRLVGNRVLVGLFRSGEINQIYDKWMTKINMPMSPLLKAVFEAQAIPD